MERLGLIGLRAPLITAAVALVIAIAAVFGLMRIRVDDSLSQLFRSNSPEYQLFQRVSHEFPSSEYDVLLVVQGKSLLERENVEKLRETVTDLQLIDGERGVISMFSARQAPKPGAIPGPVFPSDLPEGPAYQQLLDQVKSNNIIRGKLLSEDGTLALGVLALDPQIVDSDKLAGVIGEIRNTVAEDLKGSGLSSELSGVPVMRLEFRQALERDRLVYNAVGFLLGCAIAVLFFRRLRFMIIAAAPPLMAILFALGVLGWLGFRLNLFLNVMTPLIMVISFSDSMQITFAARDRIIAGDKRREAFKTALRVVGPACVLTHAAAVLSLLGLTISDSLTIREFGEAAALSTAIALVTVLLLSPALGALIAPDDPAFVSNAGRRDPWVAPLRALCGWIARHMTMRPGVYALIGLTCVVGLGAMYFSLQPQFRVNDMAPDQAQAVQASHQLDAKLTGADPVDVLVQLPPGVNLYDPAALAVIAEVHKSLEGQVGIGNVWSIETLRRWLAQSGDATDDGVLKSYVDMLPTYLVRRFISADQHSVLVTGRVPDTSSAQLLPIVDSLDARLESIRREHPGYTVAVTGLAVIAARNSSGMIDKLNHGLTLEFVFIAAFIGLAFRSIPVALSGIPSGVFPVFATGALLWLSGGGLEFSSVVALTVSFGLGLSAMIHFLNRMGREDRPDRDPAIAVERATVLVGPPLILTTLVLACGLSALAFSSLPALRIFGWLSAVAMLFAIVADLLILRPAITILMRIDRRLKRVRAGSLAEAGESQGGSA